MSVHVGAQEVQRALPRDGALLLVVGTQQVLVVEERVACRVEVELRLDARLSPNPLRERGGGVRRCERVLRAEVPLYRRGEPRQVRVVLLQNPVER